MMTKTAVVQTGKTPSQVSGKPSDKIVEGEPLCQDETAIDAGLNKTAAALEEKEKD